MKKYNLFLLSMITLFFFLLLNSSFAFPSGKTSPTSTQNLSFPILQSSSETTPLSRLTPKLNMYSPQFAPYTVVAPMTITPVFTPDNAVSVYYNWLSRANSSINVEAQYITKFDDSLSWDEDPNPIVRGLVNAHNNGVNVRVIVNGDADSDDVAGYFTSLGISVRYMGDNSGATQRITQTHDKYVSIDGKITIISSINFGENSFLNNREAGIVLQNTEITSYFDQVFELDWGMSAIASHTFSSQHALHSVSHSTRASSLYSLPSLDYSTSFQPVNFTGTYNVTAYVAPDNVDQVFFKYLKSAKQSIYVTMYTISRTDFVDTLINLKRQNPNLDIKVLISHDRVGYTEDRDTLAAARNLTAAFIPVRNSTLDFRFTHAKYWIIDGKATFVFSGNWSWRSSPPIPEDNEWASGEINRDMGVVVVNDDVANYYTQVFQSDWDAGSAWALPAGVELGLSDGSILQGDNTVSIQANGVSQVMYKIDDGEWLTPQLANSAYSFQLDTTLYTNGIHEIFVKGVIDVTNTEIMKSVKVNFINTNNVWRVLITEVMINPEGTDDGKEYFEISNLFDFDVYVGTWYAGDDNVIFLFPNDYVLPKYSSVIFADNPITFQSTYGVSADINAPMTLRNTGDIIYLNDNAGNRLDDIPWGDSQVTAQSTPYTGDIESGKSLSRDPLWQDTNNGNNDFTFLDPSPKAQITGVPPIGESGGTTTEPLSIFGIQYVFILLVLVPVARKTITWREFP